MGRCKEVDRRRERKSKRITVEQRKRMQWLGIDLTKL